MPSPFPGMNPYLEHPDLWPGIHHWLIIEIARCLSPQLRPKYRVAVEVRMYETIGENSLLVGIPDVTVKHRTTATNIECWFSILVRRLLKRASFTSLQDLRDRILDFIDYFNRTMAKPFQWKFKGYPVAS